MENQQLINRRYFIAASTTLLSGYTAMALINQEFIQMTLSPILIVLGFVLMVCSIMIPSKI